MKIRPTTKVIATTVGLGLAIWGGMELWAVLQTNGANLEPVKAGKINLIVVDPKTGYSVRVANSVAQLFPVSKGGLSGEASSGQEGQSRRLPIRELIRSLDGDPEALAFLTESVNNLNQGDAPLSDVVWTADDVKLALAGDVAKVKKLESDLNMKLDGTPLDSVGMYAMRNGITIQVPVKLTVPKFKEPVWSTIRLPYQPRFCKQVVDVIDKRFNPSKAYIIGTYSDEVRKMVESKTQEDIASALKDMVADERAARYAQTVDQILPGDIIMVNDSMLESARYRSYKDEKQRELYTLLLTVNDEARRKLWKYSRQTKDFALLVVVEGVAVSAPKIGTQLAERTVVIDGLRDKRLVQDSVDKINQVIQTRTKP